MLKSGNSLYLILETGIHRFDATSGKELASLLFAGGVTGAVVNNELFIGVEHAAGGGTVRYTIVRIGLALDRIRGTTQVPDNRGLQGIAADGVKVLVAYYGDGDVYTLAYLENDSLKSFGSIPTTDTTALTYEQGSVWEQDMSGFVQRVDPVTGKILQSWHGLSDPRSLDVSSDVAYVGADEGSGHYTLYQLLNDGEKRPLISFTGSPLIAIGQGVVWQAAGGLLSTIRSDTGRLIETAEIPDESYDYMLAVGDAVWLVGHHETGGNLFLLRYGLSGSVIDPEKPKSTTRPTQTVGTTTDGGNWADRKLTITPRSLGAVRVGMTLEQAQSAAGVTFDLSDDGAHSSTALPGLWVRDDPVTCVAVGRGSLAFRSQQTVMTSEGVQVGDTVDKLLKIYGESAVKMASKATGQSTFSGYVVAGIGGALGFEIDQQNTVASISGVSSATTDNEPNYCPG